MRMYPAVWARRPRSAFRCTRLGGSITPGRRQPSDLRNRDHLVCQQRPAALRQLVDLSSVQVASDSVGDSTREFGLRKAGLIKSVLNSLLNSGFRPSVTLIWSLPDVAGSRTGVGIEVEFVMICSEHFNNT